MSKHLNPLEKEFLIRQYKSNTRIKMRDFCEANHISTGAFQKWIKQYDEGGLEGLARADSEIKDVLPEGIDRTEESYKREILKLRIENFGGMYSGSPHKGMDIGMPEGTPVYAAADGKVTVANASDSWGYSWGYYVKINHAEGVDTLYAHLSSVAVSYGQYVHQGDVIGYVGSTGNSSGNHLHFELYLENNRVDPYPYIGTDLLSKYLERTF